MFCAHCCSNRRAIVKYGYGEPVRRVFLFFVLFFVYVELAGVGTHLMLHLGALVQQMQWHVLQG